MAIQVRCPDCNRPSRAPDGSEGKRARCRCGAEFRIPAEDPLLASLRAALAKSPGPQVSGDRAGDFSFLQQPSGGAGPDPADPLSGAGDPLDALGISLQSRPQREGRLLVLSPEAALPDRCVKCDAPADGRRLVVTLGWIDARTKLMVLALFFLAPIFLHLMYRAEVEVGICRRHLSLLRLSRALGSGVVVMSLGMIAASLALGAEYGYVLLAGVVLLVSAPVYLGLGCRLLSAARIEPRLIWIKGVCPEYLSRLPERGAG